ncbi:MAG TPA: hypothetical protein VKB25_14370 [Conexibacter sp.]|nr:hypothetical protein [Conexibacter sp.]
MPIPDDNATAAWLCAIPCVLVVLAAGYVLGPPLGRLLTPEAGAYTFLAGSLNLVHPEPTEHARYLIALSLPLLMALAIVLTPRWLPRLPLRLVQPGVVTGVQGLFAGLVVVCYVVQVRLRFGAVYTPDGSVIQVRYFTTATLLAAGLLAGGVLLTIRQERSRMAATALLRNSRARTVAALLLAVAATAIWMLHAVQSDSTLASAPEDMRYHVGFVLDETFAVLNGLTPLVDFTAQYGSLWPFVAALPLLVFGKTALVFSLFMCTLTGLALLAIYGVLRRVTRSAVAALLLYLPFLATSLFFIGGDLVNRTTTGSFYGTFPLRYAGPYFLALLTARQLGRELRASAVYVLFLLGGLTILNNADFGIAALGATVAALVWSAGRRPPLLQVVLASTAGLLTALALVALLTFARAGSLPELHRLFDYARLFTVAGFGMLPMPELLGMHLVVYLTYVAAIGAATVRALRGARDRVLTGMLAWVGIFGLGSASYYVGRSHPATLKSLLSVWALALALLTVLVVRELAAHPKRRPTIAAMAVLLGFGVTACSLAQMPAPWAQIERLDTTFVPTGESDIGPRPLAPSTDPSTRRFIATLADGPHRFVYQPGAPVAILLRSGHRIADAYGVRNISPFTGIESAVTEQRIKEVLELLQRAGGNTVILPNPLDPDIFNVLERAGFKLLTTQGLHRYIAGKTQAIQYPWPDGGTVIKWVDTHHLHPRALE